MGESNRAQTEIAMRFSFPKVMLVAGALMLTGAIQNGATAAPGEPNERFHIFSWSPHTPAVGDTVSVTGRFCEPEAPDGPWEVSLLEIYNPVGAPWRSFGVITEHNADGSWKGTIKVDQDDPNGPATIVKDDMRIHAKCTTTTPNDYHPLDSYFSINIGAGGPTTTTAAPVTTVPAPTTVSPLPSTVGTAAVSPTTAMNQLPRTGASTVPLTVAAVLMIGLGAVAIGYRRRPSLR